MPSLKSIADHIGGQVVGDPDFVVATFKLIPDAGPSDLCLCIDKKHASALSASRAGAVVCDEALQDSRPKIVVTRPRSILPLLTALFNPYQGPFGDGIHPTAVVDATATVGDSVSIGAHTVIGPHASIGSRSRIDAGVVVGRGVRIGDDCLIYPRVCLYQDVQIGHRVILHAGAVIGSDGFGNHREKDGRWTKIAQIGACVIEDDVEIGANTTVDRGAIGPTRIGRGTKIDNLCQVAHNVIIGCDCAFAACVALGGSTVIGDRVMMGGQSGATGHVTIGSDAVIMAKGGVASDVPAGAVMSGFPARPHRDELKLQAKVRRQFIKD